MISCLLPVPWQHVFQQYSVFFLHVAVSELVKFFLKCIETYDFVECMCIFCGIQNIDEILKKHTLGQSILASKVLNPSTRNTVVDIVSNHMLTSISGRLAGKQFSFLTVVCKCQRSESAKQVMKFMEMLTMNC